MGRLTIVRRDLALAVGQIRNIEEVLMAAPFNIVLEARP